MHDRARLVEGRLAEPGRDELMVGALAASKLGVPPEVLAVSLSDVLPPIFLIADSDENLFSRASAKVPGKLVRIFTAEPKQRRQVLR